MCPWLQAHSLLREEEDGVVHISLCQLSKTFTLTRGVQACKHIMAEAYPLEAAGIQFTAMSYIKYYPSVCDEIVYNACYGKHKQLSITIAA